MTIEITDVRGFVITGRTDVPYLLEMLPADVFPNITPSEGTVVTGWTVELPRVRIPGTVVDCCKKFFLLDFRGRVRLLRRPDVS